MELQPLIDEDLALNWHLIKDKVDKALTHGAGTTCSYELLKQCLARQAQCWITKDEFGMIGGVAIIRIEHFDSYSNLVIVAATMENYALIREEFLSKMEELAKAADCKHVSIHGRRGWMRELSKYGYKEPYVTIMKEV